MYIYGKITVVPELPERISRLSDLAYNLWWSWHPQALQAFEKVDPSLWKKCNYNPVHFLQHVSSVNLEKALDDNDFLASYDDVMNQFDSYMNKTDTWFAKKFPDQKDKIIAYFSAEYGLHDTLPIYSGGLGVLSGDHCKSASDLGLPFVGIGLFYKQGYFVQHLSAEGWQESKFLKLNISEMPIKETKDQKGNEIIIEIDFPGRPVYAKVWEIHVGRIKICMLDTDIPNNSANDRAITSILYGGDQEMRISQEIVLGIGGIKMLSALGLSPSIYHLNEGHSAFCVIEIIRKLMQTQQLSFDNAREVVAASTTFTTHTPVSAGSDRFPLFLMDKYFSHIWPALGIGRDEFMSLGLCNNCGDIFNMTTFALKMAGQRNGVSKLHGVVSRNIFSNVWKDLPQEEVPISSITNGIHTTTWLNPRLKHLFDKHLGEHWVDDISNTKTWEAINHIPDKELWQAHMENKKKMITFARNRLKSRKIRNGESRNEIAAIDKMLNPHALTIGFARRFATYKRSTLLFRDMARLQKIVNNPAMPVQIIFAGKAHPADYPGQELIKNIHDISRQEGFKGKVFLLENYGMQLAGYLISGVDVWLNTPRRPLEASGTSGQKVALNGGINFSVLDGWWTEAHNGHNGWAIGEEAYFSNTEIQDEVDAQSLYSILEEQIIPLYYERNEEDIPSQWLRVMKSSIKTCAPLFSTARMVQEYTKDFYIVSMRQKKEIVQNNYALAHELSRWKSEVIHQWDHVRIIPDRKLSYTAEAKVPAGHPVKLSTNVYLGNVNPNNARVEAYYGIIGDDGMIEDPETAVMTLEGKVEHNTYHYTGTIHLEMGGEYGYTFRVLPFRPELMNAHDLGLVKWVDANESQTH